MSPWGLWCGNGEGRSQVEVTDERQVDQAS